MSLKEHICCRCYAHLLKCSISRYCSGDLQKEGFMSFLVIGGLLAIGVLALVVAVFLGLGGQPEQATANASVAGAPAMGGPAIASVPQAVPPTIPLTPFSPTGTLTNNQTAV